MPNLIIRNYNKKDAILNLPGSKSDSARALIMASMADGTSTIHNLSPSDDTKGLVDCLQKLGIEIVKKQNRESITEIKGNSCVFKNLDGELNFGIAGTTARFITPLLALVNGKYTITAQGQMLNRPMDGILNNLELLGLDIEYLEKQNHLPVKITKDGINEGLNQIKLPGNISSQFISGFLMAGCSYPNGLEIEITTELLSKPYLDMTIETCRKFGANIQVFVNEETWSETVAEIPNGAKVQFVVSKSNLKPIDYRVEIDASGCSYFWGIGCLSETPVRIEEVFEQSNQGDYGILKTFQKIGCDIDSTGDYVSVIGGQGIKAVNQDMSSMPDVAQTLMVILAFADGISTLSGLKTLRTKETDRISAMQNELTKISVKTKAGEDWIMIYGIGKNFEQPKNKIVFKTYDDHRMAMSLAMIGSIINNVEIEDYSVVSKSFPSFWEKLQNMGFELEYKT